MFSNSHKLQFTLRGEMMCCKIHHFGVDCVKNPIILKGEREYVQIQTMTIAEVARMLKRRLAPKMGWDGLTDDDNSIGGKDAEEEVGAKDGLGRVDRR